MGLAAEVVDTPKIREIFTFAFASGYLGHNRCNRYGNTLADVGHPTDLQRQPIRLAPHPNGAWSSRSCCHEDQYPRGPQNDVLRAGVLYKQLAS